MKTSFPLSLTLLASLVSAAPRPQTEVMEGCDVSTSQFYLVTASSPLCNTNSSNIPMAAATSLFAPFHQPNLFLRTIAPGYGSLPVFTYTGGSLYTFASDAFGLGNHSYSSPPPTEGAELEFLRDSQPNAGLTLTGGFLLGMGGITDGWKLCDGAMGQSVVSFSEVSQEVH
jgi:hypothetical protein